MLQVDSLHFQYSSSEFYMDLAHLTVPNNSSLAIIGPSGSGKTTLLNLIAGILIPQSGAIEIDGHRIDKWGDPQRRNFRAHHIGLVFQSFELLQYLTVRDNILLPARLAGSRPLSEYTKRAALLAQATGIADMLDRFPAKLSQGESQRSAICRALLLSPKLILADEPTGNLDPFNKQRAVNLLLEEARKIGAMLIMVTHDRTLIEPFDQCMDFENRAMSATGREI